MNIALYGVPKPKSHESKQMTPKRRFLHVLLINYVMPRSGFRDHVSKIEKFTIYHLVQKIKIDITNLIFRHMEKAAKASVKSSYPYGMLMTRIFRTNDLVDLSAAISFNHCIEINPKTLALMKVSLESFEDMAVEENQQEGSAETQAPQATQAETIVAAASKKKKNVKRKLSVTDEDTQAEGESYAKDTVIPKKRRTTTTKRKATEPLRQSSRLKPGN